MDSTKTGEIISLCRKSKGMTQKQLAELLCISEKTVSKWETGGGCPDISMLEALADTLGINVNDLLKGEISMGTNNSGNMHKIKFYTCPECSNILTSTNEAVISCCGHSLSPAEAKKPDDKHTYTAESVEDELYIELAHPMEKSHYITFAAYVTSDRVELHKLYPEQNASFRIKKRGIGELYICCSEDGLFCEYIR
ncbi:MAG: helix-turn-helix domain-containing protein [Oscillospiraceae bacterium]|nr:helix-turn-helix domain-containing protein [Oscillospiraceae bacterium]